MAPLTERILTDPAVLWVYEFTDLDGVSQYAAPVEVMVRWEDKITEYRSADGVVLQATAMVYLGVNVSPEDVLWLGALVDAPAAIPDEQTVRMFSKVSNIKKTKYVRTALIGRS